MDKRKAFEKPIGFRDLLPAVTAKKRFIENKLQDLFHQWGYLEMKTPTLEYDETVGAASKIPGAKMFKLLDRSGNPLVLRPDMTSPIARVVSSILKDQEMPIRLSYHSNVFRAQENEAGRIAEFFQSGIELIGEGTPDADAEILALAVEALKLLRVGSFRLVVGHTGYLNGILEEWVEDQAIRDILKTYLSDKNMVGYRDKVKEVVSSEKGVKALLSILELQGDITKLEEGLEQTESTSARNSIDDLKKIWRLLKLYNAQENVTFDLTLVPHLEYYTGMVFEGTAENTGFPICGGGRYDTLLKTFNNPQQEIGFALKINRILDISQLTPLTEKIIKVVYDLERQEEALAYAIQLRKQSAARIETLRIDDKSPSDLPSDEDKEVIWFVREGQNKNE